MMDDLEKYEYRFRAAFPLLAMGHDPETALAALSDAYKGIIYKAYDSERTKLEKRKASEKELEKLDRARDKEESEFREKLKTLLFTRTAGPTLKVTPGNLSRAIRKLGEQATQSAVAAELGVNARSLRKWATRYGMQTWDEVLERYQSNYSL
jgi:DNA-binding transcriptional regulator YiaG